MTVSTLAACSIFMFVKIATSRIPGEDLDQAKAVLDKLKAAVEPIDVDALLNCKEVIYAQQMDAMTSQHLCLLRMEPQAAARAAIFAAPTR